MAPESVDPLAVDSRSDLYALGCLLFEMTAGRPPYGGASPFAVLEAHQRAPVPEPPTHARAHARADRAHRRAAGQVAGRPAAVGRRRGRAAGRPRAGRRARGGRPPSRRARAAACTGCGAPLLAAVAVCFGCGLADRPASIAGGYSLLVVGPGQVAEKLDASLRQALVDWLLWHPQLGLAPEPLARKVPRLPFLVASGISEATRAAPGRVAAWHRPADRGLQGGALAHPAMRKKMWKLSGRVAAVAAGGSWVERSSCSSTCPRSACSRPASPSSTGVFVSGWRIATRPVTSRLAPPAPVSPALARALEAVAAAVPTIRALAPPRFSARRAHPAAGAGGDAGRPRPGPRRGGGRAGAVRDRGHLAPGPARG